MYVPSGDLMTLSRICAAGAVGFLALGITGPASAACKLNVVNQYHVTMDSNEPLADVTINGQHVRFKVDMNAASTRISRPAAAALGLKTRRMSEAAASGAGEVPGEAFIEELKLGDAVTHNTNMMVFGAGDASDRYVGVLGQDNLSQTDLELDLANGVLRIIQPKGCHGDQVVYWGKAYSVAPIIPSDDPGDVRVYVGLDGKRTVAQVDTGADLSVVTSAVAQRAGVTLRTERVQGVAISVGTFPNLTVGDESVKNARLRVVDQFYGDQQRETGFSAPATGFPDMLLGVDFIRSHRIYVSREQALLYFSYNGGSVFQVPPPTAP
jgi:predicted aspartyl protease